MLTTEDKDSEAAQEFANIIAVRNGDESRDDIKKLVAALESDEVAAFIIEKYSGTVIPCSEKPHRKAARREIPPGGSFLSRPVRHRWNRR